MNYYHKLWALIYDQYNQGRHEHELEFYHSLLQSCHGRVLEVACGTGMILLSLLERGVDVYGFDVSAEMLEILRQKAIADGYADRLGHRVTKQDMVDFCYDEPFEAIIIPARSFLHLTDQRSQIECLRNIHTHLQDGGFLALNFFIPNLNILASKSTHDAEYRLHSSYSSKEIVGDKIDLYCRQVNDIPSQLQMIDWKFVTQEREVETAMQLRWIYREEFKLLLQLAGFSSWDLYGDFDSTPFGPDSKEMVWIARK